LINAFFNFDRSRVDIIAAMAQRERVELGAACGEILDSPYTRGKAVVMFDRPASIALRHYITTHSSGILQRSLERHAEPCGEADVRIGDFVMGDVLRYCNPVPVEVAAPQGRSGCSCIINPVPVPDATSMRLATFHDDNRDTLCLIADTNDEAESFLRRIEAEYRAFVGDRTRIFTLRGNDYQYLLDDVPKLMAPALCKTDVFFGDRKTLLDDVIRMVSPEVEAERIAAGRLFRCNILIRGKPGTGKSYWFRALSAAIHWDLLLITGRGSIQSILDVAPDKSIVLLEDVDAKTYSRYSDSHNEMKPGDLDLSDTLNVLVSDTNKRIIFGLTTNLLKGDAKKLDKALIRPGRITLEKTFGFLTPEEKARTVELYFPADKKKEAHDGFLSTANAQTRVSYGELVNWLETEAAKKNPDWGKYPYEPDEETSDTMTS